MTQDGGFGGYPPENLVGGPLMIEEVLRRHEGFGGCPPKDLLGGR